MSDWISKRQMVDKIEDLFLDKYEAKANSDLTEFYKEVLKILINTKSQPWISVKDRLPEPLTDVLVYQQTPRGNYAIGISWCKGNVEWMSKDICETLYWMPLPEPPQGENDG